MAIQADRTAFPDLDAFEKELIARYIRPHPHEHGRAYAYIVDTGPAVSAIIRDLLVGDRAIPALARGWGTTEDAVRAAIAFYHRHRPYFDARMLLEDDQFRSVFDE